jgi:hypothetical protein
VQFPELRFPRTERYTGLPVSSEKIGISNSFGGDGRRKRAFPVVWIWRVEVGRNGAGGARRKRVVEIVEGASVDGASVLVMDGV